MVYYTKGKAKKIWRVSVSNLFRTRDEILKGFGLNLGSSPEDIQQKTTDIQKVIDSSYSGYHWEFSEDFLNNKYTKRVSAEDISPTENIPSPEAKKRYTRKEGTGDSQEYTSEETETILVNKKYYQLLEKTKDMVDIITARFLLAEPKNETTKPNKKTETENPEEQVIHL